MARGVTAESPIGVFDSGLGGLTVVRKLRSELANERIIYFGDIARLPYGIKSDEQIREYSAQNTEFLIRRKVKAVVIACNSSSSAAFSFLRKCYRDLPIVDVITPAAEEAAARTRNLRVGVIGTQATIEGGAYERALKRNNKKIKVFQASCPLLVPVVEEGILNSDLTQLVLSRYLAPILKHKIDTLILGCTHYPLLRHAIEKVIGPYVTLIDSAPATTRKLEAMLEKIDLLRSKKKKGDLQVFVSDYSRNFIKIGSRFLGEPLDRVKVVRLKNEVRIDGKWV
jgi:glutamate racemase